MARGRCTRPGARVSKDLIALAFHCESRNCNTLGIRGGTGKRACNHNRAKKGKRKSEALAYKFELRFHFQF
jgi:hypothetical protein